MIISQKGMRICNPHESLIIRLNSSMIHLNNSLETSVDLNQADDRQALQKQSSSVIDIIRNFTMKKCFMPSC